MFGKEIIITWYRLKIQGVSYKKRNKGFQKGIIIRRRGSIN
jgi:hypothetical protein